MGGPPEGRWDAPGVRGTRLVILAHLGLSALEEAFHPHPTAAAGWGHARDSSVPIHPLNPAAGRPGGMAAIGKKAGTLCGALSPGVQPPCPWSFQ